MLTTLSRMVGLPVVWRDQQLGYVERAIADTAAQRLDGLVARKGIGKARWFPRDAIMVVGAACVLVNQKPRRMPEEEHKGLKRAYLTTGRCVGEVTDVVLEGNTLRVAALEVSPGPVYRLLGRRAYAASFRVNASARLGEVVVASLMTWAQLCSMLGEEEDG